MKDVERVKKGRRMKDWKRVRRGDGIDEGERGRKKREGNYREAE